MVMETGTPIIMKLSSTEKKKIEIVLMTYSSYELKNLKLQKLHRKWNIANNNKLKLNSTLKLEKYRG